MSAYSVVIMATLLLIWEKTVFDTIQNWDLHTLLWIADFELPILMGFAFVLSACSWKGALVWASNFILFLKGRKAISIQVFLALFLSIVAGVSLKGVIARPRPDMVAAQMMNIPMPDILTSYHSFPSGHVLLPAAVAVVITFHFRNHWLTWASWAFPLLVGWARIYQRLHWPTDIIGSILFGVPFGVAAVWLANKTFLARYIGSDEAVDAWLNPIINKILGRANKPQAEQPRAESNKYEREKVGTKH